MHVLRPNDHRKLRAKRSTFRTQRTLARAVLVVAFVLLGLFPWRPLKIDETGVFNLSKLPKSVEFISRSLTLAIPATFEDYMCFAEQMYVNIAACTTRPDEVVIIISGFPRRHPALKVPRALSNVSIVLHTIEEPKNQAYNKNLAIRLATSELIQFFDIDDVLFPWSISVAKTAYGINKAAIIFTHTSLESSAITGLKNSNYIPYCTLPVGCGNMYVTPFTPFCTRVCGDGMYNNVRLYIDCFWEHVETINRSAHADWCCLSSARPNFAAGWLLVPRQIATKISFSTDLDVAEDGHFIGTILAIGEDVSLIDIPIGYYNREHDRPACRLTPGSE